MYYDLSVGTLDGQYRLCTMIFLLYTRWSVQTVYYDLSVGTLDGQYRLCTMIFLLVH